ncbi:MAG: tetratricopeptide repeat protein [Streptococcaceae bacterium]|nr:tetratricopeptide repeat protein [Streptococcaceae bacterium]MCL2858221.1 tetratricopeptide repeat protein [Streptococcaceae bacterium]
MSYSQDVIDFLHKGDLIGMQNSLSHAMKEDDDKLLGDLAEYLQMMGFIDESHHIYSQLLEKNPSNTAYLINLAEIAESDGDIDTALNYLYQINPDDENYLSALIKIADLYQSEGDFDTAISKLQEALQLSESSLVRFALAESYYVQGLYQEAIEHYSKLSVREILRETKVSTYERIGESYAQLGHFENAISFLEKSLEFDNKAETVYKIALLYAEIGENSRSISSFNQLEEYNTDQIYYEFAFAHVLEEENKREEAQKIAQAGLEKDPHSVSLLHYLSRLSYQDKDFREAERYLMDALNLPEMHDETVFLLANLYMNEEDYEAVTNLSPLLEEEHLLAQWLFAQAYKELENDRQAQEIYQELMNTDLSENPEFLKDYIEFLREAGQINLAQPIIHQYLELVPDDDEIQSLLEN